LIFSCPYGYNKIKSIAGSELWISLAIGLTCSNQWEQFVELEQENMKKISVLSVLILMMYFLSAGTVYAADVKGSAVEGKVVGRDGRPLAGVKVVATLPNGERKEGYERFEAKTRIDGTFLLAGLYPGTYYRILCDSGQCNDPKERIRSLPTGETLKLRNDFVLTFSPFNVTPDGVIQDQRTGLEWAPVALMTINYDGAVAYAKSLRLSGGGWRLPTVDELKDLYESGQRGCGLDSAFENPRPKAWSSDPRNPSKRWLVRFSSYEVHTELWDQESPPCDDCRVLPVRSAKR